MRIVYDPVKRARVLEERGIDFRGAGQVFAGRHATVRDDRADYGEERWISVGHLDDRIVVVVWTARGSARRIISMRYCHAKEAKAWARHLD